MPDARWVGPEFTSSLYRGLILSPGMDRLQLIEEETNLLLIGRGLLREKAAHLVREARSQVTGYIRLHPEFKESLAPLPNDENAPDVVKAMLRAGIRAGLGPMAAVAGAIAEPVGRALLADSGEITAENGGDVFCRMDKPQVFGIVAESAPNVLFNIEVAEQEPGGGMGVCTSSGRLGPSLNFGRADAVTVLAPDTALADALATAASNRVRRAADIEPSLEWAIRHGASGVMIVAFDQVAARGAIRFPG